MDNQKAITTAIILVLLILGGIIGYNYYQTYYGPLPEEADDAEFYEENGLPGTDYEYVGPDSENPPAQRQKPNLSNQ